MKDILDFKIMGGDVAFSWFEGLVAPDALQAPHGEGRKI
jgi:hypothetical protein